VTKTSKVEFTSPYPLLEVVVTARPSWARVSSLIKSYAKLAGSDRIRISLVGPSVSRRYGDISSQIPNEIQVHKFSTLHETDSLTDVSLSCIEGAESLIRHWSSNRPDCVLVIADRTETLGVSMAATLTQIPLIHLQGGEVSGSIDDKVRDINSKAADLHLTTNQATRERLVSMLEKEEDIQIVGCPSIDLVLETLNSPLTLSNSKEVPGVGHEFELTERYCVILFHPDTLQISENRQWTQAIFNLIESRTDLNWFWFWPNPDHGSDEISKMIRTKRESGQLNKVRFVINTLPKLFIELAIKSELILGNSSFGIRESSFIPKQTLNLGSRQDNRQRASNVRDVRQPLELIHSFNSYLESNVHLFRSTIYGQGDSGQRAAEAIINWIPRIKTQKGKV
jgi:bifunctional UDP-N-acetylglucosamine 2-epimerase / N-acetylmannosamine kinase